MGRIFLKLTFALVILAALAAVLVALYGSSRERGRLHHCRNNLRQLGVLAHSHQDFVNPELRGRAYWQAIRELRYRDIRGNWHPIRPDPFVCPVHGRTESDRENPAAIDYLGPNYDATALVDGRPLAADRPGNHADGGYVLFFDSTVKDVHSRIGAFDGASDRLTD
ncbi:MAG: hypothetical protein ACYTAF_10745 [Planctomycetota bacterium]|jgi:hypothetical protein